MKLKNKNLNIQKVLIFENNYCMHHKAKWQKININVLL